MVVKVAGTLCWPANFNLYSDTTSWSYQGCTPFETSLVRAEKIIILFSADEFSRNKSLLSSPKVCFNPVKISGESEAAVGIASQLFHPVALASLVAFNLRDCANIYSSLHFGISGRKSSLYLQAALCRVGCKQGNVE